MYSNKIGLSIRPERSGFLPIIRMFKIWFCNLKYDFYVEGTPVLTSPSV